MGVSFDYLRWCSVGLFSPIPSLIMSLSDQHLYTQFIASGLRSPSLAKARVDVDDNINTYLVSADIVPF